MSYFSESPALGIAAFSVMHYYFSFIIRSFPPTYNAGLFFSLWRTFFSCFSRSIYSGCLEGGLSSFSIWRLLPWHLMPDDSTVPSSRLSFQSPYFTWQLQRAPLFTYFQMRLFPRFPPAFLALYFVSVVGCFLSSFLVTWKHPSSCNSGIHITDMHCLGVLLHLVLLWQNSWAWISGIRSLCGQGGAHSCGCLLWGPPATSCNL